jgi:hypothetical protein
VAGRIGALRRDILTPHVRETTMAVRGFHRKDAPTAAMLETVGATFLTGFGRAAEVADPGRLTTSLDAVEARFRGFAYEGAAMAFGVLDALLPFGRRAAGFVDGPGAAHVYMSYVGMGWAMARTPRVRWPAVTRAATDPLLRWLVFDGYGFHEAYFRTGSVVHAAQRPRGGRHPYAGRAIDQGIGRALWFVGGADPDVVADLVDAFAEDRHEDLWSGVGLAAAYAGGAGDGELRLLVNRAGRHAAYLAQGCAFAAQARRRAGIIVPHTELATRVLCGVPATEAADVTDRCIPTVDEPGHVRYDLWRRRIAAEFSGERIIRPSAS